MLAIIGRIGTAGGTGHTIEFAGEAIRALSMEGRMTVCNMAIEAGARAGMVAVDDDDLDYVHGPAVGADGQRCGTRQWPTGARWYRIRRRAFRCRVDSTPAIEPQVSWGTSPEMVAAGDAASVPDPERWTTGGGGRRCSGRWPTWGSPPASRSPTSTSTASSSVPAPTPASKICVRRPRWSRGARWRASVKQALVVPGSGLVKAQAEAEGLAQIFIDAGFEWREPGCSMCLAMNADRLEPGEHCASTSNRNFEGRQGHGGRTHLVSPAMAAAAAVAGHFVDVREFAVKPFTVDIGRGGAAGPRQRGHRSDHPEAVSEVHRRTGFGD